jgi:hypothetical protein
MAAFFCAQSNTWVSSGCTYKYQPSPSPPTKYPVFDPSANVWITSGSYGSQLSVGKPFFSFLNNAWTGSVTSDSLTMSDAIAKVLA